MKYLVICYTIGLRDKTYDHEVGTIGNGPPPGQGYIYIQDIYCRGECRDNKVLRIEAIVGILLKKKRPPLKL